MSFLNIVFSLDMGHTWLEEIEGGRIDKKPEK